MGGRGCTVPGGSLGASITCDTALTSPHLVLRALSELPYLTRSVPYEAGGLGSAFAERAAGTPEVKQLASLGGKGMVALGASPESGLGTPGPACWGGCHASLLLGTHGITG